MPDPLAFLAEYFAGKALESAGKILQDIVRAPANPFEEIRRRMGGEAAFELGLAFERHIREQEARDSEFRTKLREKVTEREVCALFPVLLRAAAESSTRERMRMLCAALAGIWRPDLEADLRAKVSRAVLELEPSDVLYLRLLAIRERGPGALHLEGPEGEWLMRAGCVADDNRIGGRGVRLTAVGRTLIETLTSWAPENQGGRR